MSCNTCIASSRPSKKNLCWYTNYQIMMLLQMFTMWPRLTDDTLRCCYQNLYCFCSIYLQVWLTCMCSRFCRIHCVSSKCHHPTTNHLQSIVSIVTDKSINNQSFVIPTINVRLRFCSLHLTVRIKSSGRNCRDLLTGWYPRQTLGEINSPKKF